MTARIVEAQLVADGTYPNAAAVFGQGGAVEVVDANTSDTAFAGAGAFHYLTEPRRENGEWTEGGANASPLQLAMAAPPVVGSVAGSVGPAGASAGGPHAPDGTPITLVAGKKPLRANWLGSIVGGIGSFVRRYWPEDDEPEILPEPDPPKSAPQQAQPPNQTLNDLTRVTRGFAGRKSAQKWLNQMNDRGWTPEQIEEAIESGRPIKETQRIDPTHGATRYIHPRTGRSVTIDDVSGQIIQLGGDGFDY